MTKSLRNIYFQFVAHPNIQQLLAALWYEGVPGFRRKSAMAKLMIIFRVVVFFPFYCCLYMIAPNCSSGKLMRKPFMKFLIHASSYLFFLREFFLPFCLRFYSNFVRFFFSNFNFGFSTSRGAFDTNVWYG